MSLSGFEIITGRFLSTAKPEVLCIRGAWGIGKTYAWKQAIDRARDAGTLPLDSYAYASLFGVNSLDELKQAIFDNTVGKKNAGFDASIETFEDFVESSKRLGRFLAGQAKSAATKLGSLMAHTGIASRYIPSLGPGLFLSVRDRIVCIDDLERRGEKLKIGDVLGLISMLKEQRCCKTVLLLNDKAIDEDGKKDFEAYLEKVVDFSFHFNPSPEDSCRIAFPNRSGMQGKTANLCIKLGVKNIRILGKISHFVEEIVPALKDFDESIIDQAISTVVFLCWIVYDPTNAPSLDYLKERTDWDPILEGRRKKLTPEMQRWEDVLQNYGFGHIDDLDRALLDGIQNGLFDRTQIDEIAKNLQASVAAKRGEQAFHDAWAPYHDSFDDDQDAVLDELYKSFCDNFRYINPVNVAGTVTLFKELGRPNQAAELLRLYTDNVDDPKLVDMNEYLWASEIKDPDAIAAFKARYELIARKPDPVVALHELADNEQYNLHGLKIVAQLSSADFEIIICSMRGRGHRKIVRWIKGLRSIVFSDVNNNALKESIEAAASQALDEIASESAINRRRLAGLLKTTD